jgi:cytochrome P450
VSESAPLTSIPFEQPHAVGIGPILRQLASTGPVHRVRTPVGDMAWMITSYETVRQLLADDRLGLSHKDPDNAARVHNSALFGGGPIGNYDTEHSDHKSFRSLLQPFFTPKRMRALRAKVAGLTDGLLDRMAADGPPADLHAALSVPLPILVICELLGVPPDEHVRFRAYSQAIADVTDRQRSSAGLTDMWSYTKDLIGRKRAQPGDDVISGLCLAEGGTLDDDHIAMLAAALLFAGHEATVVQIDYGMVSLLSDPDRWRTLLNDPALLPNALEECLRVGNTGRSGGVFRYARTDIDIAGTTIRAGDLVLLNLGTANRDEKVFPAADDFDVSRQRNPHVAFGHGARYCLGAPLARIELEVVFRALLDRFPKMRLTQPLEEIKVADGLLTGGLTALSVTW